MKLVISLNLEELGATLMKQVVRDAIKLEEKVKAAQEARNIKEPEQVKSPPKKKRGATKKTPKASKEYELPEAGLYTSAHKAVKGYLTDRRAPRSANGWAALREDVYEYLTKLSSRGDFSMPAKQSINTYIFKWVGR
tara:strand:+ start:389 stop:799 length:411 start_codon:yes stop_codon:yes gene_type:complete